MEESPLGALSLSKNVLAMKFMQRSRTKAQQAAVAELQTEEKWKYDDVSPPSPSAPAVQKFGLSSCRAFTYGRVSYQGFNEEIEKLSRQRKKPLEKQEVSHEMSVSDEAMASSLANTISHKFSKQKGGKKIHQVELEEGEIGAGAVSEAMDEEHEDDQLQVSEETARRMEEIKRRVQELLGEDD